MPENLISHLLLSRAPAAGPCDSFLSQSEVHMVAVCQVFCVISPSIWLFPFQSEWSVGKGQNCAQAVLTNPLVIFKSAEGCVSP